MLTTYRKDGTEQHRPSGYGTSLRRRAASLAATPSFPPLWQQLRSVPRSGRVPAVALSGMDGIGKTQLARAYAHRYGNKYRLGWRIPARTPLEATTELAALAVRLGAAPDLPPLQQLAYAQQALATPGPLAADIR